MSIRIEEQRLWGVGYPDYQNFERWGDIDFEKYQKWCLWIISKGSLLCRECWHLLCRECWHLHCHPDVCTMQTRVVEQYKALIETGVFPKEICKMIALEIPEQDRIN